MPVVDCPDRDYAVAAGAQVECRAGVVVVRHILRNVGVTGIELDPHGDIPSNAAASTFVARPSVRPLEPYA